MIGVNVIILEYFEPNDVPFKGTWESNVGLTGSGQSFYCLKVVGN